MVTMVTMVLSWSRALSVRSGGRPTALFSLFRDTSGRKGGVKECESGSTHTRIRHTRAQDAKMPGVIHASIPRLVLHQCPSRAVLPANCLPISPTESSPWEGREYGAFLPRIRRSKHLVSYKPIPLGSRDVSPQRRRKILPEKSFSFSIGQDCDLDP